ncbi:MAG: hypothetical protein Q9218_005612 [Villophora microphyllina]
MVWFRSRPYMPLGDGKNHITERDDAVWTKRHNPVYVAIFWLSLVLNIFLVVMYLQLMSQAARSGRSRYAQLAYDHPLAWQSSSTYYGEDKAIADRSWDAISIDNGTVALDDSYVKEMELPMSQRFPWDEGKGLYLLNGFHSLHCLKTVRQLVLEFDRGLDQSEPTEHILHCLDALRQDIICYADDTPRYTGLQPQGRSDSVQRDLHI